MILHSALRRGLIGFVVGEIAGTLWTYILVLPGDAVRGLIAVIESSTGRATLGDDVFSTIQRMFQIRDGRTVEQIGDGWAVI